jgi:hypothetical protein
VRGFVQNICSKLSQQTKATRSVTTPEVDEMKIWWIKLQDSTTPRHERTKVALNLQKNVEAEGRLLECWGRIQGKYPT